MNNNTDIPTMNNNTTSSVKTGDIFLMSWGYDQTNVNFFQVTRVSKAGFFVREISQSSAGKEGFMCQDVTAVKDSFLKRSQWCGETNEELFRKGKVYDSEPYFSIKGRYNARLWNGTPTYNSWYA